MTGSGTSAGLTELGELRVEVRSVNARGLLIKQRLCAECSGFEAQIEELVRKRFGRGTITLVLERTGGVGPLADRAALQKLVQDLRLLARDLGLQDDLGLRDVIALVGLTGRSEGAFGRELPPQLAQLLAKALDNLRCRREADGATTLAAMQEHLRDLDGLISAATQRAPELVNVYRDKLLKRVTEFLGTHGLQLQAADVVREVALFADRIDVSEELQRLGAHLAEVRALLAHGGELGRRLEFLLQELLREANTLGSKSPDVAMAHVVVGMKSDIDKLKEQAANLE